MHEISGVDVENRPRLLPFIRVPGDIRYRSCRNCNRVVCMDSDFFVTSKLMVANVYHNDYRIDCLCGLEIGYLDKDDNVRLTYIERRTDFFLVNHAPDINEILPQVALRSAGIDSSIESDPD